MALCKYSTYTVLYPLARLTDIVKGVETGGRVIARKTNGERNRKHDMQEGDRERSREGGRDKGTGDDRSR